MGNFNPMPPRDQGGIPLCFPLAGHDSFRHYPNHFPQAPSLSTNNFSAFFTHPLCAAFLAISISSCST